MLKDTLPLKVDPFRFADNSLSLDGTLLLKDMLRLVTSLSSDAGEVQVELQFGVDEENIRYVKGQLNTCLQLQCQRCLESFNYEIISPFLLGIVHTEQEADKLPDRYDPLIVTDLSLIISEMIEDELIVSLPIVPMHDLADCKAAASVTVAPVEDTVATERENPFKVIESLRSKRDSK